MFPADVVLRDFRERTAPPISRVRCQFFSIHALSGGGGAPSVVNQRLGRPGVEVHVGCARVRMSYGFR